MLEFQWPGTQQECFLHVSEAVIQTSTRMLYRVHVQGNASEWERWATKFAADRQLAVLAPLLPTSDPVLRGTIYEMVLHNLLQSPADHPLLLKLVQAWPAKLYSLSQLNDKVLNR